ncbi:hypothetical protein [Clostridium botulinum]|uniref:hypothetical protein n=1 Tax=Clostridium botulinum TaxID=1491 RepID=UPI0004CFF8D2|nr:hypothetical protein [Clostridium botulinum]APC82164.1 AAA-like domain protein [Clostridium botulinum]AXG97774.1 hypothetical protein AGE31_19480 [Clostridium botulinum]MBY6773583.1 hypothetical protein [Clostridium botulinum]MBY6886097.1 hypothetical protein [Clostridium botulinum]
MFNKIKSITLKDYFQIQKPTYKILKLTPDTSIRNYNSSNIAKAIQYMYKSITQRIHRKEKKFFIETQVKCSYMIDIQKDDVNFYFVIPERYEALIKEKITETWPKVTIELVTNITPFSQDAVKYELKYNKEDALSLNVDKKCNEPLNSILNVLDILEEGDRVGIFYNFMPAVQRGWRKEYQDTIDKIKNNEPIDREKFNVKYIAKEGLILLINLIQDLLDTIGDFFGVEQKKEGPTIAEVAITSLMLDDKKKLSRSTVNKKDAMVLNTQMVVLSDSVDIKRQENNAVAVLESYNVISEDNELIYKKIPKKNNFYVTDFKIAGAEENKLSTEECQNFLQLPGRELLQQHKVIEKIDTLETEVPKELREGSKLIGINEYKGSKQNAYLTTDKDYKSLAVTIVGPTRSGKTSFMGNIARNSIDAGECIIVLDYIENCSLSDDIKECIPDNKVLEINLYDHTKLQGLGYNEAITNSDDIFMQYESAKKQTSQLITLVNSINVSNSDFTPKMERYLTAASLVAFINNGAIKDVFKILQNHKFRKECINTIPENQSENLEEYVEYLRELDEWSKGTKDNPSQIIGTHSSYITGIIDRVQKLKSNTYMELMLKKDCGENINLLEEMEENQAIFIKMPENMFSIPEERDIMTTYWLTKIWMCAQARAWKIKDRYARKTVTVFTDEIAQLKSSEQFIGNKLDQTAKFGVKFILSTMYINQLRIREKLRTANTSYILISGSDKINYIELKDELNQFGYELEDLMNLKRFHSLNYIKYQNGYWAGITKLPPPVK